MKGLKIKGLVVKKDERGSFVELIRREDLESEDLEFGQIALTTAKKNETKGKHYHKRKTEWFCVIEGIAQFRVVDKNTDEEEKFVLDGKNMKVVKVSPFIWHSIENIGDRDLYILVYVDEPFNLEDPDTFKEDL